MTRPRRGHRRNLKRRPHPLFLLAPPASRLQVTGVTPPRARQGAARERERMLCAPPGCASGALGRAQPVRSAIGCGRMNGTETAALFSLMMVGNGPISGAGGGGKKRFDRWEEGGGGRG